MSDIYHMPGHLIRRLHQISLSIFQDRMKAAGTDMTPVQFATLEALSTRPGIDQATLAGLIAYDRATIGGVVDRLETKGLVARATSPRDRRAKVLELSSKGVALIARLNPVVEEMQSDILPGLSADERDQFIALATRAAAAGNDRSRAPLIHPG